MLLRRRAEVRRSFAAAPFGCWPAIDCLQQSISVSGQIKYRQASLSLSRRCLWPRVSNVAQWPAPWTTLAPLHNCLASVVCASSVRYGAEVTARRTIIVIVVNSSTTIKTSLLARLLACLEKLSLAFCVIGSALLTA